MAVGVGGKQYIGANLAAKCPCESQQRNEWQQQKELVMAKKCLQISLRLMLRISTFQGFLLIAEQSDRLGFTRTQSLYQ